MMKSRLEEIKRINEERKQQKSRLEGRLESLNEKLKELGCENVAQLKKLIEQKEAELNEKEQSLNKKITELENYIKGN